MTTEAILDSDKGELQKKKMLPLLPRYVKHSTNVTQGISLLVVLKDPKKKASKGSITTVQLMPSKRGKNTVTISAMNSDDWHGKMNSFHYYTYATYLKSEAEAQIAGVVSETHRYGLSFTFFTPLVVNKEEILNLHIPYECYFKELLTASKSVSFTAIGLKGGNVVDIGRYITNHDPSKVPMPVSLTFNLAGELDFSPKLYMTEYRDLHKTRSKCTSYLERMKKLTDYIAKTGDLTWVILTYKVWVDSVWQQHPKGRCEMVQTFLVPIFRDTDTFWTNNFRTTYNPYDIDAVQAKFDLQSPSIGEKIFLAQYIHAGKGFYSEASQKFTPVAQGDSKSSVNTSRGNASRSSSKTSDISAEYSKLTAFQSTYNSLLYAPDDIVKSSAFEPTTAAEYVLLSTPCAAAKVLYKYLYLRETLTASILALPERLQCPPGIVLAAVSFVAHTQYTKCLNHCSYNTMDLVSGQRALFLGHHLKADPNFLFNADHCTTQEVFELVTESGNNQVVKMERFDKVALIDEAAGAPLFEDDTASVDGGSNRSENGAGSETSETESVPRSAQPTAYRTTAGEGAADGAMLADLQAQLDVKDRLIAASAENMRVIEMENERLYEEIAELQKKLGIPQTYEPKEKQGDTTFSEMQPASLSQITTGLGNQRDELLTDLDNEIQGIINMSRRRENEINALATQIEHGGGTDSLVKEYLERNKKLEDDLIAKDQELAVQKKSLDAERDANQKLQKLLDELKTDGKGSALVDEASLQKLRIQYENQIVNLKKENLEKVQGLHMEIQRLRATHETKMREAKKRYEEERNKELKALKRRAEEDFMAKLTEIKLKIKDALTRK